MNPIRLSISINISITLVVCVFADLVFSWSDINDKIERYMHDSIFPNCNWSGWRIDAERGVRNMDIDGIYLRSKGTHIEYIEKEKWTVKKKNGPIKSSVHKISNTVFGLRLIGILIWCTLYTQTYTIHIHTGTPPMKSSAITLISPRYCNLLLWVSVGFGYIINHYAAFTFFLSSFLPFFVLLWYQ